MTKIIIENENGKYYAEVPSQCLDVSEMLNLFKDVMSCAGYCFNLGDRFEYIKEGDNE